LPGGNVKNVDNTSRAPCIPNGIPVAADLSAGSVFVTHSCAHGRIVHRFNARVRHGSVRATGDSMNLIPNDFHSSDLNARVSIEIHRAFVASGNRICTCVNSSTETTCSVRPPCQQRYDSDMPFEVNIDHQRRLVASVWRGNVDVSECVSYIDGVWGDPAVQAYNELVDFRDVEHFDLQTEDIERLVFRSRAVADPGARARSAMVASDAVVFGLSRMYVSLRDVDDEHRREWRVLEDYDEAVRWLDGDSDSG